MPQKCCLITELILEILKLYDALEHMEKGRIDIITFGD